MPLSCQQLLQKYPDLWRDATVHPFLTQCQSGEIQPQQFNTWLVQDYLFVIEFTRLTGALITWAPIEHFDGLLGGMVALKDELNWFRNKAAERQLTLDAPHQLTCQTYCAFMVNLATAPYAVMATAFWAIEFAYNQGWQLPGKMPEPYTEFANRWGNLGFTEYVKLLETQADEMLRSASPEVLEQAEQAFIKVAQLEKDFWQMAFNAD